MSPKIGAVGLTYGYSSQLVEFGFSWDKSHCALNEGTGNRK